MGNNTKITIGSQAIAAYEKSGQTILNNCQNILKNANVPIPIVNKDNQDDEKLTGIVLEHSDDIKSARQQSDTEVIAEEPTVNPNEQNVSAEQTATKQDITKSQQEPDKSEESKGKNKNNHSAAATSKANFTNSNSTVHNTYSTFTNKENQLSSKSNLKDFQQKGLDSVSNFVDTMEDIEAAGQAHIDALEEELPESGYIEGSVSSSYQNNVGEKTFSLKTDIKHSWQNKNKTFAIVAGASYGYEETKTSGETFDIDDEDLAYYDDDDAGNDKTEKAVEAKSRKMTRASESDEKTEVKPSKNTLGTSSARTLNFALYARYKKGDFMYGGGLASEFAADKSQVHDQFITVKNISTNIAGDLMRRTRISYDPETGERISKSEMKLKLDILNRGKNEDIADFEEQEPVSEDIESNGEDNIADENLADVINNDDVKRAKEDAKADKIKDGSGWDIDFKYDSSVCGIGAEYGINLINNQKKKTRLTVAPLAGIYNYTSASDNSAESLKTTLGFASEFKKTWKDGQSVDASLSAVANRVVSKGSAPSDLIYTVFSGSYKNPRKNFNADVDAGIIKSNATITYIEAGVSKQFKDFNIKAQGGYTKVNFGESKENSFQFLVTGTYNIPYKTKK